MPEDRERGLDHIYGASNETVTPVKKNKKNKNKLELSLVAILSNSK